KLIAAFSNECLCHGSYAPKQFVDGLLKSRTVRGRVNVRRQLESCWVHCVNCCAEVDSQVCVQSSNRSSNIVVLRITEVDSAFERVSIAHVCGIVHKLICGQPAPVL